VVCGAFQLPAGPIGAGGPDGFTDHSFETFRAAAEARNAVSSQRASPGSACRPISRGCATSSGRAMRIPASPSPVDFFSPDTFNYTVVGVAADGTLTVMVWDIPSYPANTFSHDAVEAVPILGFQIALQ
jgi:alkaline phosphatase D